MSRELKPDLIVSFKGKTIYIYECEKHFIESEKKLTSLPKMPEAMVPKEFIPDKKEKKLSRIQLIGRRHEHLKKHLHLKELHTKYAEEHIDNARFIKPYWNLQKIENEYRRMNLTPEERHREGFKPHKKRTKEEQDRLMENMMIKVREVEEKVKKGKKSGRKKKINS